MKFWLERGVHGFKVIAASHLIENADMRDEPLGTKESVGTVCILLILIHLSNNYYLSCLNFRFNA